MRKILIPALTLLFSCGQKHEKYLDEYRNPQIISTSGDTVVMERLAGNKKLIGTEVYVKGELYSQRWHYGNGIVEKESFYKNGKPKHETWYYTPQGKLAEIQTFWYIPNNSLDSVIELKDDIIFWQKSVEGFGFDEYQFISESGFYIRKDGIDLDEFAIKPDNFMEIGYEGDSTAWFIWKNKKRYFLSTCIIH